MQSAGDYGNKTVVSPAPAPAPAPLPVAPTTTALPQAYVPPTMQLADLYKDPTILAFLRSSGLSEQVAANEVARRQAALGQALNTNLDDLGARGQIERRNIAGSQESRGMFRSGQTLQKSAEQEAQEARLAGAMQQQTQNSMNDLSGNLTMQIAQNQQKAAELGTQSYLNQALANGKSTIDSNYSDPYGLDSSEDQ